MLTLYQFEISPFCDKIRRVLAYKQLPYEIHEVGLIEAQTSYRRISPSGKCPALADDGRIVADSTDIAYYLEERHPDPPLVPADVRERAWMHVLEDWADESLYFYEMRLRFGIAHNRARTMPKLLAHENVVMRSIGPWVLPRAIDGQTRTQGVGRKNDEQVLVDVRRHLDALEALLSGRETLVGERLSLADIAVFCMLYCIRDATEGESEIAARPALVSFLDRVDRATSPVK
jgi:glutathione S-transferase